MNKVVLMGRLTRDHEIRYSQGENSLAIARYTLAVDRRFSRNNGDGSQTADFIPCVVFGKPAEFAEQYFKQGMRVTVCGRIQTGSYTNREGQKVYTTEVVVEEQEFAESKNASQNNNQMNYSNNNYSGGYQNNQNQGTPKPDTANAAGIDGFMNIPDGIDEELPFN